MRYAIPGRPEVLYGIGDTVKVYPGIYGEIIQRHNKKVVIRLQTNECIEVPDHYIIGVITT